MDKYFNYRECCTNVKTTSRFGRLYQFDFPNGHRVEVSRDMTSLEQWLGFWRVDMVTPKRGHVRFNFGYKMPKGVEKFLHWVEELPINC